MLNLVCQSCGKYLLIFDNKKLNIVLFFFFTFRFASITCVDSAHMSYLLILVLILDNVIRFMMTN